MIVDFEPLGRRFKFLLFHPDVLIKTELAVANGPRKHVTEVR